MADIELVIKLSEEEYKHIKEMQFCAPGIRDGKGLLGKILLAIRTGTLLPKGHGRLIDVDKLHHCECKGNFSECDTCLDADLCNLVNEAPTIIEADKEGANDTDK